MHQVVEHCLARVKADFIAWFYNHPSKRSMAEYEAALQELFFTNQTADVIGSDVQRLPTVFKLIEEAEGGRIPKKWR